MIKVKIERDETGEIAGFSVRGHSGLAEKGQDIICAAVSALTQGVVIGLERVLGLEPEVHWQEGKLDCSIPVLDVSRRDKALFLMETMVCALQDIEKQHPQNLSVVDEGR